MSSALAVAAVTQVLKDIIDNALNAPNVPGISAMSATITALPPDKIDVGAESENNQLNIFMYMTTPNLGWRNHAFPSRDRQGQRVTNPYLSLDLHFLLSAYGNEELNADMLLGFGMQLLHETPVLVRDEIRSILTPPPGGTLPTHLEALQSSGLAEQIEQIKITPESLNTEEISRLWTAFGVKYRQTAFYKASVVLIESQRSTRIALPVQQSLLYVRTFQQPTITKLGTRIDGSSPIRYNQTILSSYQVVLTGVALRGEITQVRIGGETVLESDFISLSDTQLIFPIPANLAAGIHGVQVMHQVAMGEPPTARSGFNSNAEALVLSPSISSIIETTVNAQQVVRFELTPEPTERQRVTLLLNQFNIDFSTTIPAAYTFEQQPDIPSLAGIISIPIDGVTPGDYLVRVRVGDTMTPLASDYQSPNVTITA